MSEDVFSQGPLEEASESEKQGDTAVAVIGMAGRFPEAVDIETFWRRLRDGTETVQPRAEEELRRAGVSEGLLRHHSYVAMAASLPEVDLFDAPFFEIGPREAALIDPQQRLFLEHAHEALERAGYDPERFPGLIGVWAGASPSSYLLHLASHRERVERLGLRQVLIANAHDYLATRVAFKLNLRGPAYTVQTACSTSLVAVHLACQGLINYETDIALAGGVSVRLPQGVGYLYEEGGIVSPDGHTRPFDADARGTVFSSGVGVVVLKRLADALDDGDTVLAVIRGSAVNNDGSEKAGFTAPNVTAQSKVITEALAAADIDAGAIGYVEAHGTGTELGDPIEVAALTRAFRRPPGEAPYCALGSVKANIGHLDAAAGVAGLIKTVLMLRQEEIPPHPTFRKPNPKLRLDESPFRIAAEGEAWPRGEAPRRAGVSSFGIGGTNAHVVLEEAPPAPPSKPSAPWQLLLLSGRTPTAVEQATANLGRFLEAERDTELADVAHTLAVGRRALPYRRAVVYRDREEARANLAGPVAPSSAKREHRDPPVAFLLPGQGAQQVGMGEDLFERQTVFRSTLEEAAEIVHPFLDGDLLRLLYPPTEERDSAAEALARTEITQPALFAVQVALARLWRSWGVEPAALLGHSLGEYTAACLAGVFSFEDGLRLVATRGRLIADLDLGAMLAVDLPEDRLLELLEGADEVEPAAINAPSGCTIAGPAAAVAALRRELEGQGVDCRPLDTSHAFHSAMMEPALEPLRRALEALDLQAPQTPYLSNLTGTWITVEAATDPEAWLQHLRKPVRFADGLAELLSEPSRLLLEVGPGTSLGSLARRQLEGEAGRRIFSCLGHPRRRRCEREALLTAVGGLWTAGVELDLGKVWSEGRRRIPLPTYSFERKRYWLEGLEIGSGSLPQAAVEEIELPAQEHERPGLETPFAAPESPTEDAVAAIWRDALGVSRIGLDDDFFELGGDSLLATRVLTHLRDGLGVTLKLDQLFERTTIRGVVSLVEGVKEDGAGVAPVIEVQAEREAFPLAYSQERLWALCRRRPDLPLYNEPRAVALEGAVSVVSLQSALAGVVERHEILRTTFHEAGGRPVQRPGGAYLPALPVVDLSALDEEEATGELHRLGAGWVRRPFDLETGPLLRTLLVRRGSQEHALLFVIHHLISDGWSSGIFNAEVAALYGAAVTGESPRLPALPIQYGDFAVWQRRWLQGEALQASLAIWRDRLADPPSPLTLPPDRPRRREPRYRGRVVTYHLSSPGSAPGLEALNRRVGTTAFMTVVAAFQAVLARVTGHRDILLGAGIANRRRVEVEPLLGFFVNNLVLRTDGGGDPSFETFLSRVRATTMEAFAHQDVPFDLLLEALRPHQERGAEPLFRTIFAHQNFPRPEVQVSGLRWRLLDREVMEPGAAKFDLTLFSWQEAGELSVSLQYDTDLYDTATVERFLGHFRRLLEGAVENPRQRLSRLPLLSATERRQLIGELAGRRPDYPRDASMPELFLHRVAADPTREAVAQGEVRWSYGRLAQGMELLARSLVAAGVEPGHRVAVYLERSVEMVAAILAVLRVGATYVPIDPGYPAERVALLLEDSGAVGVITDTALAGVLPEGAPPTIPVEILRQAADHEAPAPGPSVPAEAAACLFYTSGSTGRPKAVVVSHRAIVRLVMETDYFQAVPEDRIAHLSNPAFDASSFELWAALLHGGAVEIVDRRTALEPGDLARLVVDKGVTALFLTTALFQQIARRAPELFEASRLRAVIFGGEISEVATIQAARRAAPASVRLIHAYGPTESATFTTCGDLGEDILRPGLAVVPIGSAIANSQIYVVDSGLRLLPLGVPGELVIGGDGLAQGYFGRPSLTADRFVPDPFGDPGGRLYRTGDQVRRLGDGAVEFLGRFDTQVKLRGFRVELGEIEAALSAQPQIQEAVVLMLRRDSEESAYLAAYLQPAPGVGEAAAVVATAREALLSQLPAYMVPAGWEVLERFPLNANGKIDRRALKQLRPRPQQILGQGGEARTEIEAKLVRVWSELLGVPTVGRDDDFFELGGDSILAIQLSARAHAAGLEVTVRQLFEAPTIAELARQLEAGGSKDTDSGGGESESDPFGWDDDRRREIDLVLEEFSREGRAIEDVYPLTPMQQGMLYHTVEARDSGVYHEQLSCMLDGEVDLHHFETAWQQVVQDHAVLRTAFLWRELTEPIQVVLKEVSVRVDYRDWRGLPTPEQEARFDALVTTDAREGFRLRVAPLIRLVLMHLDEERYRFLWSFHHLLLDGWSVPMVLREIFRRYEEAHEGAVPAPVSRRPFRDFLVFLAQRDRSREEVYWRRRLAGFEEALVLDAGRSRSERDGHGQRERLFSPAATEALQQLARRHRLTLNTFFQAVWALLLYRYNDRRDCLFGTVVAGRPPQLPEVESMVGLLLNTAPIRVQVRSRTSVLDWLREVQTLQAEQKEFEHTPLADLQAWSELPAGRPLFESLQVFENYPLASSLELGQGKLAISGVRQEQRPNYPLAFLTSLGERLSLRLLHDRRRYDAATAERILAHAETLLRDLVERPDAAVESLTMLSEAEQRQVTLEWNNTVGAFRDTALIHQLVEEQVARTPDAVAVVERDGATLTYREVEESANRLAHHLRHLGIGRGDKVAVLLDRSASMVPAVLGVLKAGAAYVPLELTYPPPRVAYILDSMVIPAVLVRRGAVEALARAELPPTLLHVVHLGADDEIVEMDAEVPESLRLWRQSDLAAYPATPPEVDVEADELAYIIFTSGSTGAPKGVMERHRPVVNLIQWLEQRCGFGPDDRVLFITSLCFDLSVYDIFGLLAVGGSIRVAAESEVGNPEALSRILVEEPITFWDSAPAALQQVAPFLPEEACGGALRRVFLSGDWIPLPLPERVRRAFPDADIISLGGATEATVWSNFFPVGELDPRWLSIPYGRPIGNARYYVLDHLLRPLPVGVPGDLYIGGECLSSGYAQQPRLTAERYLPDPYYEVPGAILYRTGDRARFYEDGNIEFLGRLDHQVKIRGYRIELGEIEAALKDHPDLETSVALVRQDTPGERRLVAYVVPTEDEAPSIAELRRFLKDRVPEYMVPSAFVTLNALPVTANGKLDRKALPAPEGERPDLETAYVAPRTPVEKTLAAVWSEVLGVDQVGIHDNYFELGGDSILTLQIISRGGKVGLTLGPRQLFEYQTIAELATVAVFLDGAEGRGPEEGQAPLTPIQYALFERPFVGPQGLNEARWSTVDPAVSSVTLSAALDAVAEHHDAFRLFFIETPEGRRQVHSEPPGALPWTVLDLQAPAESERATALRSQVRAMQESLRVDEPPLARATLVDFGGGDRRLLLVLHPLIVDGASWSLLLEDLSIALDQHARGDRIHLGSRSDSLRRWSEHLESAARDPALAAESDFWLAVVEAPFAPLPGGITTDPSAAGEWSEVSSRLDQDSTHFLITAAGRPYRMEVDEILLTALARTLGGSSNGEGMRLDLEVSARESAAGGLDLSRTLGRCTVRYPVRLVAPREGGAAAWLRDIKEQLRAAPATFGRGVGYGLLRRLSADERLRRRLGEAPSPSLLFHYAGPLDRSVQPSVCVPVPDDEFGEFPTLMVEAAVREGRLEVDWRLPGGRSQRAPLETLAASFEAALEDLLDHCRSAEAGGYTPSDFPLAGLPGDVLETLLADRPAVVTLYPLSPMQEGMLFHNLLEPESALYIQQLDFEIQGTLDADLFLEAWRRVSQRHEVLRSSLLWSGLQRPLQCVDAEPTLVLERQDWRQEDLDGDPAEEQRRLRAYRQTDRARGFALDKTPLSRLAWIDLPGDRSRFFWSISHLVIDGWSGAIVLREVLAVYDALSRGEVPQLGPVQRYSSFIQWLERHDRESEEAFWKDYLKGFEEPTPLPLETDRGLTRGQRFGELHTRIPAAVTAHLESLARRRRVTLNTVVQAVWGEILRRTTNRDDVVFGVTVAGRSAPVAGIEEMVGLFINTLPLRLRSVPTDAEGDPRAVLSRLQAEQVEMRRYEASPLVEIQRWAGLGRGQALFETLLVFENFPLDRALQQGRWPFRVGNIHTFDHTNFPITLTVVPGEELSFRMGYDTGCLSRGQGQRLMGYIRTLLDQLQARPDNSLDNLSLLTEGERRQIVEAEPGVRLPEEPSESLFHAFFEERLGRHRDAVAVVAADGRLTYDELDRSANRLAHHLGEMGAGPERPVAVCLERSTALIVAILAILKSGSPYLPLDPAHPPRQRAQRLEDAGAALLVGRSDLANDLPSSVAVGRVDLDAEASRIAERPETSPRIPMSPDNLAYILYTSGSTGHPKGVMVRHRSMLNLRRGLRRAIPLLATGYRLRVGLNAPLTFDVSVHGLLALLDGHSVSVLPEEARLDTGALFDWLRREPLEVLDCTPTHLELFVEAGLLDEPMLCPSLFQICGEEVSGVLHHHLTSSSRGDFFNIYGPTEATVYATLWDVRETPRGSVIGRPMVNVGARILDHRARVVPVGVAGELCLAGPGLARGYHGRPAKTAERFIPDPHTSRPGGRLYRTGDRARWLERSAGDLWLEYLGRTDQQVKVRGFRVELGEIETTLVEHPDVAQGAVVAQRATGGEIQLAAFVTPREGARLEVERLRCHLRERLPEYEIPTHLEILEEFPLTASDKLDRKALEARRVVSTATESAPESVALVPVENLETAQLEGTIVRLWSEVLGVERVGPQENFFDLGGHSLHLARVHLRLREELERDVPMVALFEHPTARTLAAHLSGEATAEVALPTVPPTKRSGAIAVVGMSARFPAAPDLEAFWENLLNGVEAIRPVAAESGPERPPGWVSASAALEGIDLFDAGFFGYSPREAETLDPQHRLFLEEAWAALESAGHDPSRFAGRIGCYAGAAASEYALNLLTDPRRGELGDGGVILATGVDQLATRVSYKLNLKGPALTVQTACSTSLVAIHMACRAILEGECEMALAGGVAAMEFFRDGYHYLEGSIFSPDGHCRAFDAAGAGTVPGSGVGVVVLRPLEDALADGDPVRAVVLGSAINNDGSNKVSFTAPSVEGQRSVILAAQRRAGVEPAGIGYVEAHGTATPMGDPVEFTALTQAFRSGTDEVGFCRLGSVKTNIGHADAAAGVAGFLKAALAVERGEIPPSLHFESPNSQIDLEGSPFRVASERLAWRPMEVPRRAGVSSFGIGGTNAHAVLEEPPVVESAPPSRERQLLVLSARSEEPLEEATDRLADFLADAAVAQEPGAVLLADVAHTLQQGRRAFATRRILVAREPAEAVTALRRRDPRRLLSGVAPEQSREVIFLFPGQGSQFPGMARGLYDAEPVFRDEVDRCCGTLTHLLGEDLRPLLLWREDEAEMDPEAAAQALERTDRAQAAIFVVEFALVRLWLSWGVVPRGMVGHSIGEITAACLAGVMELEDALALVAERGRLMADQPVGSMLGVALGVEELTPRLPEDVELAAINGPEQCVVSGPTASVADFAARLEQEGIRHRPLHTSHAFHSAMMESAASAFANRVAEVSLQAPRIPFQSNVSGRWIEPEEATDAQYWGQHLRSTVHFSDNLRQMLAETDAVLLEVGPGRTLTTFAGYHRTGEGARPLAVPTMRHPRQEGDDGEILLESLGRLWLSGVEIPWDRLHTGERRRRRGLPTYPFQRRRYWIERRLDGSAPLPSGASRKTGPPHKLPQVGDWLLVPSWRRLGSAPSPLEDAAGEWLVVTGEEPDPVTESLAESLSEGLRAVGGSVALAASVANMAGVAELPSRIIHLGGFGQRPEGAYGDLLALGRRLALQAAQPTTVWAVTAGVFEVGGQEPLRPAAATALGPARVLPQELPHVRCYIVDLERSNRGSRIPAQLLGELASPHSGPAVAYRGAYRWTLETAPLPGAEAPLGPEVSIPRLRRRGVYLLTGGLGNIGQALAKTLVERCAARLVLAGRAPPPEGDPRIEALRALGGEVEWVRADVTDEAALAAAVERAEERFGSLRGVIHTAGVIGPDTFVPLTETDERVTRCHFGPKVEGVENLARILERRESPDPPELDFVLLASSISALLGGLGMSAYAAANAYLNTFAAERSRENSVPWISVAWDGWSFQESGDGRDPGLAMSPQEGCETFVRILRSEPVPEVVVSTANLEARLEQWVSQNPEVADGLPTERHPRPQLGTAYVAPTTPEEARLAAVWAELLGMEEVGIHDNFYDLGGDSILALRIVGRATEEGIPLSVPDLYRYPTVAELASAAASGSPAGADEAAPSEGAATAETSHPFDLVGFDEEELSRISDLVDQLDD